MPTRTTSDERRATDAGLPTYDAVVGSPATASTSAEVAHPSRRGHYVVGAAIAVVVMVAATVWPGAPTPRAPAVAPGPAAASFSRPVIVDPFVGWARHDRCGRTAEGAGC